MMNQENDTLTLYRLMVLYMLSRVTFPMTRSQISDFMLERNYTDFLTLQQVFAGLIEARLIESQTIRNRTHLALTDEGRETLRFFENRISPLIKNEINAYFLEKEYTLRNEVSVLSDYNRSVRGGYQARLTAKDRGDNLVEIILTVPTEDMAADICDNWQEKNQEVYQKLIELLF